MSSCCDTASNRESPCGCWGCLAAPPVPVTRCEPARIASAQRAPESLHRHSGLPFRAEGAGLETRGSARGTGLGRPSCRDGSLAPAEYLPDAAVLRPRTSVQSWVLCFPIRSPFSLSSRMFALCFTGGLEQPATVSLCNLWGFSLQ